jgi:hypothetical protein
MNQEKVNASNPVLLAHLSIRLEEEVSRLFNYINDIDAALQRIKQHTYLDEKEKGPQPHPSSPQDYDVRLLKQITDFSNQNNKLNSLLVFLNTIA